MHYACHACDGECIKREECRACYRAYSMGDQRCECKGMYGYERPGLSRIREESIFPFRELRELAQEMKRWFSLGSGNANNIGLSGKVSDRQADKRAQHLQAQSTDDIPAGTNPSWSEASSRAKAVSANISKGARKQKELKYKGNRPSISHRSPRSRNRDGSTPSASRIVQQFLHGPSSHTRSRLREGTELPTSDLSSQSVSSISRTKSKPNSIHHAQNPTYTTSQLEESDLSSPEEWVVGSHEIVFLPIGRSMPVTGKEFDAETSDLSTSSASSTGKQRPVSSELNLSQVAQISAREESRQATRRNNVSRGYRPSNKMAEDDSRLQTLQNMVDRYYRGNTYGVKGEASSRSKAAIPKRPQALKRNSTVKRFFFTPMEMNNPKGERREQDRRYRSNARRVRENQSREYMHGGLGPPEPLVD
jgi:hypothetical protein